MTTTLGRSAPTAIRRQPFVLSACVGVAVIAGWLVYDHWAVPRLSDHLFRLGFFQTHWWAVNLGTALLMYGPFAVVLLLWGRTARRRVGGALVALAAAGYMWGLYEIFSNYVWSDNTFSQSSGRVYEWLNLLVLPTLAALAWGVARRWGRVWVVGLLVAPALATLVHELQLHSTWWQANVTFYGGSDAWLRTGLAFVAPAVGAATVCWLIDAATARRGPATESSA